VSKVRSVILVHGEWCDSSCWSAVIRVLESAGISAIAVHLSLAEFSSDVATLTRAIELAPPSSILVGHSYGGAVITEGGISGKVSGLIYLAGFSPDTRESISSITKNFSLSPIYGRGRANSKKFLRLTRRDLNRDLAHDLTQVEKESLFAMQSPINKSALKSTVTIPAWRCKRCWYLVATSDRVVRPALQKMMAGRMNASVLEVQSGHMVMLSHPILTAKLILQAKSDIGYQAN